MKQNKKLSLFLSGVLAGAMLMGCATAAFAAASGSVRFGTMDLEIKGKRVITAGETLTDAQGCEIPSTLIYTNEQGGDTTYLPIRKISELLDIPVFYKDSVVYLGSEPASGTIVIIDDGSSEKELLEECPLHQAGATAGVFTEVEPVWPANDKITSYSARNETVSSYSGIGGEYEVFPDEGGYCSIKIENHTDRDLTFGVSQVATITRERFPLTVVPAGETVIRTFRAGAYTGGLHQPKLSISLHRALHQFGDNKTPFSVTVNVCTFDPERTGPALFG